MDCNDLKEKKLFPIREVSEITGVKPVTLRAWQRRYGLVQPERTEKGHRLYTEDNIQAIQDIQSWLAKGVSIGKVKALLAGDVEDSLPAHDSEKDLEEVLSLLSALSTLNKGKAESIISMVLKEYPLEIVTAQFVLPIISALGLVKGSQRTIQKGLFQSLMMTRLAAILEAESKANTKGKCLFLNLDPVGSVPAWLSAVQQAELGFSVTMLDGVEDISGILNPDLLSLYARVKIFSNRALVQKQQEKIENLLGLGITDVVASEVINKLHLPG